MASHSALADSLENPAPLGKNVLSRACHTVSRWRPPSARGKHRVPHGGKTLQSCSLRAKTKTTLTAVNLLEYADDCAIVAHSEAGLQSTLNLFVGAYERLGLSLNINQTKVLHQPAPGQLSPAPKIFIGGHENVEHFAYLGTSPRKPTSVTRFITELNVRVLPSEG